MISTNKTQPTPAGEPKELKVLTTNSLRPREFSLRHDFPAIKKREPQKFSGMLTTQNLEERARIAKRAECAAAIKALMVAEAQERSDFVKAAVAAEHKAWTEPEKKKAGRPKKEKAE